MEDIEQLLTRLGLTQYLEQFSSSGLELNDLIPLSVSELNDLLGNIGVLKGHAIKIVMSLLKLKSSFRQSVRPEPVHPAPQVQLVIEEKPNDDVEEVQVVEDEGGRSEESVEERAEEEEKYVNVEESAGEEDLQNGGESRGEVDESLKKLSLYDEEAIRDIVSELIAIDLSQYYLILDEIASLQAVLAN